MPCVEETSEFYFKRALWFNVLCLYDEVRNISYWYVWDETVAGRGAQEIGSCLYKHFIQFIPKDTRKVILYSNSSGKNRNIKISLMIQKNFDFWGKPELEIIEQRFSFSGHANNSCIRSFDLIEKQKRITKEIFVPSEWINVIKQAKKSEPKFVVT